MSNLPVQPSTTSSQSLDDTAKVNLANEIGKKLDALYEQIPKVEGCIKGCTDCCGPVPFSLVEAARAGPGPHQPTLALMKKGKVDSCLACPHSWRGDCEIYDDRPLMCRMFAAVDDPRLTCPHGAKAVNLLTQAQGNALIDAYLDIQKIDEKPLARAEDRDELAKLKAHRRKNR